MQIPMMLITETGESLCAGRVDDVINVSGHRIGTAEVESALVNHPACAEAAVVPVEHPIKGQGIYAFVTLMEVSRSSLHLPSKEKWIIIFSNIAFTL